MWSFGEGVFGGSCEGVVRRSIDYAILLQTDQDLVFFRKEYVPVKSAEVG